jgi:3-oxoacyl-[acyl-carrier-protein] synthase-1
MSKGIHIVRVAARTPVGLSAAGTAAAIRARVCRLSFHPFMVDPAGNPLRCGHDAELDPQLSGTPRFEALAAAALEELLEGQVTRGTVPVLLALPEPRPGFDTADAAQVLRELGMRAYEGAAELSVRATAAGHAGALRGIAEAMKAIRTDQYQLCAVGGVDTYFDADALDWLDAQLLLDRDGVRGGFPPGEAAAFVLLASDEARRALKLPSLAQILGAEYAQEKRTRDSDEGFLGEALSQAILAATRELKLPDEQITDIFCDMNGERMRGDDWAFALLRAQRTLRDAGTFVTGAPEFGDIGAASGAVSAVLAVESFRGGYAQGPRALLWGSSWQGLRAACVLKRGES